MTDVPQELVGGGDTQLHYHLADRATNAGLQSDSNVVQVTAGTYTVRDKDDFLEVDTTGGVVSLLLPVARNRRELEVIFSAGSSAITVTPNGTDTIMGETSATLAVIGTALRLKAISSNWVAI